MSAAYKTITRDEYVFLCKQLETSARDAIDDNDLATLVKLVQFGVSIKNIIKENKDMIFYFYQKISNIIYSPEPDSAESIYRMFIYLIDSYPKSTKTRDYTGKTVLNFVCMYHGYDHRLVRILLDAMCPTDGALAGLFIGSRSPKLRYISLCTLLSYGVEQSADVIFSLSKHRGDPRLKLFLSKIISYIDPHSHDLPVFYSQDMYAYMRTIDNTVLLDILIENLSF